jgi:hypothetical protein
MEIYGMGNKRTKRKLSSAEDRNPLLERLSWVSTIASLGLGIVVWFVPSPISVASLTASSVVDRNVAIIRFLACVNLVNLAAGLFIFKALSPLRGKVTFKLSWQGDWFYYALVFAGAALMAISLPDLSSMSQPSTISSSIAIAARVLVFLTAMFMTLVGLRKGWGLVEIQGEMSMRARLGWLILAGLVCLPPLLTLAVGLVAVGFALG